MVPGAVLNAPVKAWHSGCNGAYAHPAKPYLNNKGWTGSRAVFAFFLPDGGTRHGISRNLL